MATPTQTMGSVGRGEYGSTPTTTDATKKTTTIRDKFGIGEALLNDPKYGAQLKKVFDLWKAGKLTEAEDEYYKTDWSKLDTDVQSRYLDALENQGLYKERLRKFSVGLQKLLAPYGVKITDDQVKDYYDRGIDEEVILDDLIGGVSAKSAAGVAGTALDDLRATARANGFNLDKDFGNQVDGWLRDISRGASVDDFKRLIRQQAKLGLPEKIGSLLDEGLDLANVYAPYRNAMASLLEVTPDSINLDDPLLRSAYGQDKEMSVYDFKRAIRKDPRWQYTDNAREEVSNAALGVLRDFGFQG